MAKKKPTVSSKSAKATLVVESGYHQKSNLKWIIGGAAFLLIIGFIVFTQMKDDNNTDTVSTATSITQQPDAVDTNDVTPVAQPSSGITGDIAKKITGDWYVKERLVAGNPTTKGKIGMGSWQFYDDGSLKYTTSQYADLGTWKLEGGKLTVTLYALGNYSGEVTDINNGMMTWVTKETIDGKSVAVSNRLARRK